MIKKIKNIEFIEMAYRKQPLIRLGLFSESVTDENYWLATYSLKSSLKTWRYQDGVVMPGEKDYDKLLTKLTKKFEKDLSLFEDIFRNCYYIGELILNESEEIAKLCFEKISTRHLLFILLQG